MRDDAADLAFFFDTFDDKSSADEDVPKMEQENNAEAEQSNKHPYISLNRSLNFQKQMVIIAS